MKTKKPARKTSKRSAWGFDLSTIDTSVRPQDDLYHYVNGNWLKNNPIPSHESRWGSFTMLRYETEKQLRSILKNLQAQKSYPKGSPEQMIRDSYASGIDMKRRNKLGIQPIEKWRTMIRKLHTTEDLLKCIIEFHRLGVGVLWGTGIDQDAKQSDRYILHIGQGGLGLPDRDYYLNDDAESKRVRTAYVVHIQNIFRLIGQKPAETVQSAEAVMRIETQLAKASMKKEDLREIEKTYHKKTLAQLERHTPKLQWNTYLKGIGAGKAESVIFMQPDFFSEVESMLSSIAISDWKIYFEWHLVSDFSGLLSQAFVRTNFAFYGKVLAGSKKMKPLWRRILSVVNGSLSEVFGQIYVKTYFSPESKKKAQQMVEDLFTAYRERIKKLDWMSPATKKKALKKLDMMVYKIGYPDKWKSYAGLVIKSDDFVGNTIRVGEYEHKRELRKLGKPVDRKEWFMSPQTVNAYCNPTMNEIVFPAAIMQWPFFDLNLDDAINYGSMGMTIGHEITHNFDDQGSKFDGKGNLKSWWTKEDRKRFDAKAKKLVEQFNTYKVADGVSVNGQLTLGENIADLGGASIAFDAYKLHLARSGKSEILDGFTPEQRFFLGFSIFERENVRPEFEKMAVLTDPHSPGIYRINGIVTNLSEFYETFGVKKGDKLYRDPASMAKIW
jgi:putative endopeptidase